MVPRVDLPIPVMNTLAVILIVVLVVVLVVIIEAGGA
jgi:hypothetical protein